ncbi:hypothetical protein [Methylobacterium haplocladii]|uniref:Uncharacterized protein n=1 Tax=Methylobacterium haplocladii TaxID=1176176 RepID=A0A512ISE2_9HYPH|nr:hypothetical protein [Methylobacterium haplocladii]GEP00613.1 hypothetical protein MHA02_30000 [Methylobacterium haplocladii]GJD85527.1 hypothetical protein HPGCJGGD_3416 [Methylobacterium haplocladii]GLS57761.1 hypothetical protein GCM10007887_04170 [Methylobacterium haplocladii]
MAQRKPVALLATGLAEMPAGDTIPIPAYGASGVVAACKLWIGEASTTSTGAWSVDLSQAGFTAVPKILASALSADTTIANSAVAITTGRTLVAASGFVNLPNTIAIGGMPEKRAGAGLTVSVLAIGP